MTTLVVTDLITHFISAASPGILWVNYFRVTASSIIPNWVLENDNTIQNDKK